MASMTPNCTGNGYCIGVGGCLGWLPPVNTFNPVNLNTDQWIETAVSMNAKYAVLVTQHCSGFSIFPTEDFVLQQTGFSYTYSVEHTTWGAGKRDVVAEFIASCKKYNVKPGFYYSLNENYYLNVGLGKVVNTPLVPGQAKVTQDLYRKIALAQQRLLWTRYGQLFELWFDGGDWPEICPLSLSLQPNAVYFNGFCGENNVRWIGTETGLPAYPVWSTTDVMGQPGGGTPTGQYWNPAESDTTPTEDDNWFWHPGNRMRSLKDLIDVYHHTVGQNSNLLLDMAPDNTGLVPKEYVTLYKDFGDWQNGCYKSPIAKISGNATKLSIKLPEARTINRIMIQEDQTYGQRIREFSVQAGSSTLSGSSVGNKYIGLFTHAISTNEINLQISVFVDNTPVITNFAVYFCSS